MDNTGRIRSSEIPRLILPDSLRFARSMLGDKKEEGPIIYT